MTPALLMCLAALLPTAQYKTINGAPCLVLDITPYPNRTHKKFCRIVHG